MIRAFVSSTYVDLKEHQAAVIGRLTAAGIFVDPVEKWTAAYGISYLGLLLFGWVTNAAGGLTLPPPAGTWQISSGPDLVTVPACPPGA